MEESWVGAYAPQGKPSGSLLHVRLQPGAAKRDLSLEPGALKLKVTSPPHEDRANRDLIDYLSDLLGIAKGRISILRGQRSRNKVLVVSGILPQELSERIHSQLGP